MNTKARALYAISKCESFMSISGTHKITDKVRLLYDRSQPTARIVVKSKADIDTPLVRSEENYWSHHCSTHIYT